MKAVGAGMAMAVVLVLADTASAGPTELPLPNIILATHRAEYTMSLSSARMSGGVTGASGKMSYRFADSCDGWIVENKTALTFAYTDGGPVATTWEYVTWESKDGLRFRFRVRSTRDGVVSEEIAGTANLDGRGKAGLAHFTLPEVKTMRLPKGTVFPTEHTLRLIEAAQKGERILPKILFDGTDADGPFDVNAVIGHPIPANTNASPALNNSSVNATLLSAPSWWMQLAFYPQGSSDPAPDYEIGLRYYLNGVSDQMLQSFGDFALKATLDKLEPLPKPDC